MRAEFEGSGSVVIVTGGGRGIGAAAAAACADAGATVVALDIAHGFDHPGVECMHLDVAERSAVLDAVEVVARIHGRIDGLIAGAAVQPRAPLIKMAEDDWRRVLAVNLDGVAWACQAVVPHMIRQRRGSVVVFSSGLAQTGYPGAAAYAASKAALTGLAKSLAAEVAGHGVRVNVIAPGVIDTAQFRAANTPEDRERWLATTGIGTPEAVVGPLLFLPSTTPSPVRRTREQLSTAQ